MTRPPHTLRTVMSTVSACLPSVFRTAASRGANVLISSNTSGLPPSALPRHRGKHTSVKTSTRLHPPPSPMPGQVFVYLSIVLLSPWSSSSFSFSATLCHRCFLVHKSCIGSTPNNYSLNKPSWRTKPALLPPNACLPCPCCCYSCLKTALESTSANGTPHCQGGKQTCKQARPMGLY